MTIILIAHAAVVKVADPPLPEYDKQSIHLYKTESLRGLSNGVMLSGMRFKDLYHHERR